jgi:hypothetical protein
VQFLGAVAYCSVRTITIFKQQNKGKMTVNQFNTRLARQPDFFDYIKNLLTPAQYSTPTNEKNTGTPDLPKYYDTLNTPA